MKQDNMLKFHDLTISERIKVLQKRKRISTTKIAKDLGITPQSLNFNLQNERWRIERIKAIARILGVRWNVLSD